MSDVSYIRKEINATDFTNGVFVLDSSSVDSTYIPRSTDIITVTPSSAGANIKCWVEFVSSEWRIYLSDLTYTGKVYYRLKSRSY